MTTLQVVDGGRGESLTETVARRLRGQMAELRISGLELARMTGMGRAMISRRINGDTALNTDELEAIERATGISTAYLLTGINPEPLRPKPGGGSSATSGRDLVSERSSVQSGQEALRLVAVA